MGGVRVDAAVLFPLVLDRIADERSPSGLLAVSRTLELKPTIRQSFVFFVPFCGYTTRGKEDDHG